MGNTAVGPAPASASASENRQPESDDGVDRAADDPKLVELLRTFQANHPTATPDLIARAYRLAADAHRHQLRMSGDPYIEHPLATAKGCSM